VLRIALPGRVDGRRCASRLERDEHDAPLLVTGVLADITDFLALQEQLGQAKRLEAIGTLTGHRARLQQPAHRHRQEHRAGGDGRRAGWSRRIGDAARHGAGAPAAAVLAIPGRARATSR
jgi:hypothetical protein